MGVFGWDADGVVKSVYLCNALVDDGFRSGWDALEMFAEHPTLKFVFAIHDHEAFLAIEYELGLDELPPDATGVEEEQLDSSTCRPSGFGHTERKDALVSAAEIVPIQMFVKYCSEAAIMRLTLTGYRAGGAVAQLSTIRACAEAALDSIQVKCITFGSVPVHMTDNSGSLEGNAQTCLSSMFLNFECGNDKVPSVLNYFRKKSKASLEQEFPTIPVKKFLRYLQKPPRPKDGRAAKESFWGDVFPLSINESILKATTSVLHDTTSAVQSYASAFFNEILEVDMQPSRRQSPIEKQRAEGKSHQKLGMGKNDRRFLDVLRALPTCEAPPSLGKTIQILVEKPFLNQSLERYTSCICGLLVLPNTEFTWTWSSPSPRITELRSKIEKVSVVFEGTMATFIIQGCNLELLYSLSVGGLSPESASDNVYIERTMTTDSLLFIVKVKEAKQLKSALADGCNIQSICYFGTQNDSETDIFIRSDSVTDIAARQVEQDPFAHFHPGLFEMAYMQEFKKVSSLADDIHKRKEVMASSDILRSFKFLERELLHHENSLVVETVDKYAVREKSDDEVKQAHKRVRATIAAIVQHIVKPVNISTVAGKAVGVIGVGLATTALFALSPLHGAHLVWLGYSSVFAGASTLGYQSQLSTVTASAMNWMRGHNKYVSVLKGIYSLLVEVDEEQEEGTELGYEDSIFNAVEATVTCVKAGLLADGKAKIIRPLVDNHDFENVLRVLEPACSSGFHRLTVDSQLAVSRLVVLSLNVRRLRRALLADPPPLDDVIFFGDNDENSESECFPTKSILSRESSTSDRESASSYCSSNSISSALFTTL